MSRHRFALGGICFVVLVALAGCSPAGKIWASVDESGLIHFTLCEEITATTLRVRVQGDQEPAWVSSGEHEFAPGDGFAFGKDPEGFLTVEGPTKIEQQDTIVVSVLPDESSQQSGIRGVFAVDDLAMDTWVAADGRVADTACD